MVFIAASQRSKIRNLPKQNRWNHFSIGFGLHGFTWLVGLQKGVTTTQLTWHKYNGMAIRVWNVVQLGIPKKKPRFSFLQNSTSHWVPS